MIRPKRSVPVPTAELTAYDLRQMIERAQQALGTVSGETAQALPQALAQARASREQFWLDTCHEVWQMRTGIRQAVELHVRHGCRFAAPSAQQVHHVLKALDAALPTWDRDHPELFFQTLEINFPETVRCRRNLPR